MMTGFERYSKKTRRVTFLEEMEQVSARARVARPDRAPRPESGQRLAAGGGGADAAPLLSAAVVQPVRTRGGRGAIRLGGDAAFVGIDLERYWKKSISRVTVTHALFGAEDSLRAPSRITTLDQSSGLLKSLGTTTREDHRARPDESHDLHRQTLPRSSTLPGPSAALSLARRRTLPGTPAVPG